MRSRVLRLVLLLVVASATALRAQSIVTAAGGGTLDGQRFADIPAGDPRGVTLDRAGNVYVVTRGAEQVLKVDAASGIVTTIAGNGAAGFVGDGGLAVNAALRQPDGVVLDAGGNVYIADTLNNRVRRVDAKTGFISTFAGGGNPAEGIGDGGLATSAFVGTPAGLAIFGGSLYITEQAYNANRVRRVDMATGKISTVAGSADPSVLAGFAGDGGQAKDARLDTPLGIAFDAAGNLYFADRGNKRVRRIDGNGVITTYAQFDDPTVLAFDPNGNLLVASNFAIRRVDKATQAVSVALSTGFIYGLAVDAHGKFFYSDQSNGKIFTFTPGDADAVSFGGGGAYVGDERAPTDAILHSPQGLTFDAAGSLIIADRYGNLIRRVSAVSGKISTIAGIAGQAYANDPQEGIDATKAVVGFPVDIDRDGVGNIYIADLLNDRIWMINGQGKISTYAGGGNPADGFGDNGPATGARIVPHGISLDSAGNLYIADADSFSTPPHARIRRVDAKTQVITTVAGTSAVGYAGDGGPATQAQLDTPSDVLVDDSGVMLIADTNNNAIRGVTPAGVIGTVAGRKQDGEPAGDGGPASGARLTPLHMFLDRATHDVYVADFSNHRVRRIDRNGIITTVAGSATAYYEGGFGGDNGPATSALLNFDYGDFSGIALDANGDVYFADSGNNRIRVVSACHDVVAPSFLAPVNGAVDVATSPSLKWNATGGAFRYDVLLDTANPPVRIVATDLDQAQFVPANLHANTTYFWSVVAKSDRFCPAAARSTSAVFSFTTVPDCTAGAFDVVAPAEGAGVNGQVHLQWQPSPGAGFYDVYLGSVNPPPLVASVTQTSFDATARGASFWFVVAHAACDATHTASTPIHTFTVAPSGCGTISTISATAPANHATNVATTVDLAWSVTGGVADSIDVYFGTSSDPPLLRSGLAADARALTLPALTNGTTYFWRIAARSTCFPNGVLSTTVASFTTRACAAPGGTSIVFVPNGVTAGVTYGIVWSPASGLDAEGGYLVERSTSPSFATILDAQVVSSTAASFLAPAASPIYHRVRALASCDPTKAGPPSDARSVSVVTGPPNVIFTVHPQAVITALGDRLEDQRGSFTVENIGPTTIAVIISRQELAGSKPFFSIGGAAFTALEPHQPRTFAINYSGPPNDVAASYQGVIVVSGLGQSLAATPYAFVNLKVGGGAASAAPQFQSDGVPIDYAAFVGAADDANRVPLQVTLHNPGTTPIDLAAEIGPEVWLVPESGWNSTPLAAGASRTIKFTTQRTLAPSGPLPRYTYFTVRTKDGASARLLVQDNDNLTVAGGRSSALSPAIRSFIVPQVVSESARLVSRIRLSNVGGDSVQAELIFTPAGSDGFDAAAVKRTIVVLPPNDVVTLTDPLVQIFGLSRPAAGQLEVRLPRDRTGLVGVRGVDSPVVNRGDGAVAGAPHVINLLPSSNFTLTLAETSGADGASVHVTLFDAAGNATSSSTQTLSRYGMLRVPSLTAARAEIRIDSGGGSVIGLATLAGGATVLSTPENAATGGSASRLLRALWNPAPEDGGVSVTTVVPVLATPSSAGAAPSYKTALGLVAGSGATANFSVRFYEAAGGNVSVTRQVAVSAGATQIYSDVLTDLFGVPNSAKGGSVYVQGPVGAKILAVVQSATSSSYLNLPTTFSEALTSAGGGAQRPLFYDGLEQSTDPTRGTRWLLVLNETSGVAGTVNVRLYEAGNRANPIASLDVPVGGYQQKTLDTIFSALGLDAPDRRKDRTNVEVVVTAVTGSARVSAAAVSIDNQTGDTKTFALTPAVGSGSPNVSFTAPVVTTPPSAPARRRVVGH